MLTHRLILKNQKHVDENSYSNLELNENHNTNLLKRTKIKVILSVIATVGITVSGSAATAGALGVKLAGLGFIGKKLAAIGLVIAHTALGHIGAAVVIVATTLIGTGWLIGYALKNIK